MKKQIIFIIVLLLVAFGGVACGLIDGFSFSVEKNEDIVSVGGSVDVKNSTENKTDVTTQTQTEIKDPGDVSGVSGSADGIKTQTEIKDSGVSGDSGDGTVAPGELSGYIPENKIINTNQNQTESKTIFFRNRERPSDNDNSCIKKYWIRDC